MNVDITVVFITHDLDEAIYLADRIVVLAAHPGRIAEVIEVPVPRPRTPRQLLEPAFLATRRRLDELIHPPQEAVGDKLPMIRLTRVEDDVL
jgi:NitT/TauT family transport system ATP-binding protein